MPKKLPHSRTRPPKKRQSLLPAIHDEKVKVWLLVADGASANFYQVAPGAKRISAIPGMALKQGRGRPVAGDKPGRTQMRSGQRRAAMEPRTDPHMQAETNFLKTVATTVNGCTRERRFDRLIVAAPPRAMAELRGAINAATRAKIALEITHEWTKLGVREIAKHLQAAMEPA